MKENELVREEDVTVDQANGTATWDIIHTGPVQGTYGGRFTFRCMLSPLQEIEADRDYRELLGKNAEFATTHIENLAYTLSQLKQRVIQAPPFWSDGLSRFPGSQIKDSEVLTLVMAATTVAELKYRELLQKRKEDSLERLRQNIQKQQDEKRVEDELSKS